MEHYHDALKDTCDFDDCKEPAEGTLNNKKTGVQTRGCAKHLRDFLQNHKSSSLQRYAKGDMDDKPRSFSDKISACTEAVQVHELMAEVFKLEATKSTKKKLYEQAEKKIQSLKGQIIT